MFCNFYNALSVLRRECRKVSIIEIPAFTDGLELVLEAPNRLRVRLMHTKRLNVVFGCHYLIFFSNLFGRLLVLVRQSL